MTTPNLMGAITRPYPKRTPTLDNVVPLPPRRRTTKGRSFPPTPVTAEDVARLLQAATPQSPGWYGEMCALRFRALIVVLYRTAIRISEALDLVDADLMREQDAIVIRHGKGDKRRVVVMDAWGWRELENWLEQRRELPDGPIFCVIRGVTAGQRMAATDVRRQLRHAQHRAGINHRCAPHQFRHGWTIENFHEGQPMLALQRQLGHAHPGVTTLYLRSIDTLDLLAPIAQRKPPMIALSAALQLGVTQPTKPVPGQKRKLTGISS